MWLPFTLIIKQDVRIGVFVWNNWLLKEFVFISDKIFNKKILEWVAQLHLKLCKICTASRACYAFSCGHTQLGSFICCEIKCTMTRQIRYKDNCVFSFVTRVLLNSDTVPIVKKRLSIELNCTSSFCVNCSKIWTVLGDFVTKNESYLK